MTVRISTILLAFILGCLPQAMPQHTNDASGGQEQYRCTPCGLSCDRDHYAQPGTCRHCGMALVKSNSVRFSEITPESICAYIAAHPGVILLDVRSAREFNSRRAGDYGKLKGAINIPIQELEERLDELSAFKEKEIIVYCSHSQRSPRAGYLLGQNGFSKVFNMSGGMSRMKDDACRDSPQGNE